MHLVRAALAATLVLSIAPSVARAQSSTSSSSPSVSVPRLINLSGIFRPADGQAVGAAETVTFAVYAEETGGAPIWQETQQVTPDASGRYTVLLGATQADGVPLDVFASGGARWLGMIWTRGDENQGRRSRLTFVPYAVHATDADTLGGKPASAYALTSVSDGAGAKTGTSADPVNANTVLAGTPGHLAVYAANGVDIMNATTVESGGRLGVGTTAPLDYVHAQFTDASGGFTGFAVQNLSGGAAAYSGTLFYDQNGALGQFQGFNNSTHEYRINNVAKNGPSFNGSINFMVGGTSRFFVNSGSFVGIGTAAPSANLEVSNATTGTAVANVFATTFAGSGNAGFFVGRHARGTSGAPTAVLNGDSLAAFLGMGFGTSSFSGTRGGMFVRAAENWTDAAQGTALNFNVTPTGTTSPGTVMTVTSSGDIGVGTFGPLASIDVVRTGTDSVVQVRAYGVNAVNGATPAFFAVGGRGTSAAPAAIQSGDLMGFFGTGGVDGGPDFYGPSGGLGVLAMENWTPTAHGAASVILSTAIGGNSPGINLAVLPNGNVGIGTTADANGVPTAADKLEVGGDIRVGTGTTGCVKDADATVIAGVCSSDRRLKKDITPFGFTLDSFSRLQPVHFYWRSAEYPDRHLGTRQSFGLIAQDVEQVLPELVETDKDGFKAVNYSKLPLFTIQAVKELKAENDALKQRVAELELLKARMADLERRLAELAGPTVRR